MGKRIPLWMYVVILPLLAIPIILLSFREGGYFDRKMRETPASLQGQQPKPESIRVPLLGEDTLSVVVFDIDRDAQIRPGYRNLYEGPPTARAHFDDGTEGPITKYFGVKGGKVRFSGPAGQTVVIRSIPPAQP